MIVRLLQPSHFSPLFLRRMKNQKEWDNKKRRTNSITEFCNQIFSDIRQKSLTILVKFKGFSAKGTRWNSPLPTDWGSRNKKPPPTTGPSSCLCPVVVVVAIVVVVSYANTWIWGHFSTEMNPLCGPFFALSLDPDPQDTHTHALVQVLNENQVPPTGKRRRPMAVRPRDRVTQVPLGL